MKYVMLSLLVITLGGCNPAPTKPDIHLLPDIVKYPKEVQSAAVKEALGGSCPVLATIFMPDYGVMRDQTLAAYNILK